MQKRKKKSSSQLTTKQFKRSQNINNLVKVNTENMFASCSSFILQNHKNKIKDKKSFQFQQNIQQQNYFEVKRKSFQDFIQSQQSNISQNLINRRSKKQQSFEVLAISYDNKIKPIHQFSKFFKQQAYRHKLSPHNYNHSFNIQSPPNRFKAYFKVSNNRRMLNLPYNKEEQTKDQKFKGFKECMKPIKLSNMGTKFRFKTKRRETQSNCFDFRPWTGRRQRQEQSDQSNHILNCKS